MKELVDGREQFRAVFGGVPIGVVLENTEGRLLESNPAFDRMLGYEEGELYDSPRVEVPGEAADMGLYGELVRGEREGFRVEKRYVRKDGRTMRGRFSATLYGRGDDGEPLVVGVVEDVDEQRRAEEDLNTSERRFRAVVEQSPVSIHLFKPNGLSLVTNAAWDELWNLEENPEGSDIFEDEQLAATGLLPYVRESVASGVPMDTPPLRFDPAEVGREGSVRWLEASVYPVRDEAGRVSEMVLTVEDVTEHKNAQKAVEESEERFRSVVQNASDITTVLEKSGAIRYTSPATQRVSGYASGDLAGENAFDYVHPQDIEKVRGLFERVVRNGGVSEAVMYRFRRLDGSWCRLESVCSVPDEGGEVVVNSRDITDRVRVEEDLKLKNRAIEASSNGIIITGAPEDDYPIVYFNPALERISGYSSEEVLGHNPRFLQGQDGNQPDIGRLHAALVEGREWSGVLRNYKKDGALFWNEMYVAPVRGESGRVTNWVGIQNDVTERRALEEQLSYQAFHDSLTGLPNRALFTDRLGQALERARRHGDRVAVLFMDLDNFKYVNDSLGHEAGDNFLCAVAERVREVVRPADTVARLGGDEFAVLLEELADEGGAPQAAAGITAALERPIIVAGQEVYASFSIGISMSTAKDGARSGDLLRDADAAMYDAKRKGKSRYQLFEPGMGARASERLELESALRRAIDNDELRLHYQPKVLLESGEISGTEALVRWEHPEKGMVPPLEFIPLAEETGLIVGLGHWVLKEACRQARAWRERYGDRAPSTVWVNLSAKQFHRPDLAREIVTVLEETGLSSECLGLEITESVLMEYGGATVATLEGLKSLGIKLAVDDFGTGYSSLSYLKRLPVDYLKVDRSFVAGLGKNPEDEALVSAIITLAQALKLRVVAEGVETTEQLEYLTGMGCDLAQGYHFSRPLPGASVSGFLEDRLAD